MKSDREFLARGALINGIGFITRIAAPALVILLARVYPQAEFGLFISLQALVMTIARAALLGVDKGLLWHVPKVARLNAAPWGVAGSLWLSTALGAVVVAGCALLIATGWYTRIESLEDAPASFLMLMAASVLPFCAVNIFSGALEGARQPQYRVFLGVFLTMSLVPALALALKDTLGNAASLGAGMFFGHLIGALLFIPALRRHFPGESWARASRPPAPLLRYSLPLAGTELVTSLLMRVDLWMVLLLLGPESAAVYAIMITLANGLRSVRQAFDPLLIPIISNLQGDELKSKLKSSFSYATNMVSTLQLFIACFILLFPHEILSLAGKDYAVEVFAFALLLLGNLANGFLGLNGAVLLGMGKSRLMLALTLIALALTVLCNWLFIPRFGLTGAALATVVVLILQNFTQYAIVRWRLRLSLYEPHLYMNAVLELALVVALFVAYSSLETYTLGMRGLMFGLLVLGLGAVVLGKQYLVPRRAPDRDA